MAAPRFEFEVGENKLSILCSFFGKEVISLNDQIISTSTKFFRQSKHAVGIDGKDYTIILKVNNPFTGHITCSLYENENLIITKYTKAKLGDKNKVVSIVLLIASCGSLGYFISMIKELVWISPVLFVVCVALSMSVRERIFDIKTKT